MNAVETNECSQLERKRHASWDGVGLAHYYLRAGEIPEHQNDGHLIMVSLS